MSTLIPPTPYFESNGITIYHADCREVLPTIRPADVSLVLTDPPYGMALNTDYSKLTGTGAWNKAKGHYKGKVHDPIEGDELPFDPSPLLHFPRLILFGADHYADKLPASRGWIVWDKREELGSNMLSDAELAWTNIKTPTRIFLHVVVISSEP